MKLSRIVVACYFIVLPQDAASLLVMSYAHRVHFVDVSSFLMRFNVTIVDSVHEPSRIWEYYNKWRQFPNGTGQKNTWKETRKDTRKVINSVFEPGRKPERLKAVCLDLEENQKVVWMSTEPARCRSLLEPIHQPAFCQSSHFRSFTVLQSCNRMGCHPVGASSGGPQLGRRPVHAANGAVRCPLSSVIPRVEHQILS